MIQLAMIQLALCTALALAGADDLAKVNQLGPVSVKTTLTPAEPTIGDEITLEIRVEAAANVEVLMPEFGEALDRFTILDFVPKQNIADDGKSVLTQRYTLQPYLSGPQSIPPILIEFVDHRPGQKPAPDDLDAYEVLTDRIDFDVKSVLPTDARAELKPPLGELDLVRATSPRTWTAVILGTLAACGVMTAALVYLRKRRRRKKRRNAYQLARARLDRLLSQSYPQDERGVAAFFVAISSIVRHYLEDRFELHAPDLTTEEFLVVAGSASNLSREHQALLRDFLRQADLVKFAGLRASEAEARLSSDLARRFLEETRENAPMIEVPDAMDDDGLGGPSDGGPSAAHQPGESREGANV